MASPSSDSDEPSECPVCGPLELAKIFADGSKPSLRYLLSPQEPDREALQEWAAECDLCKLVVGLERRWLGAGDDDGGDSEDFGTEFWYPCGDMPTFEVSVDYSMTSLILFSLKIILNRLINYF